jgi:outer membrane protein
LHFFPGITVLTAQRKLLVAALLVSLAACYPPLPGAGGTGAAAPAPSHPWTPSAGADRNATGSQLAADQLPSAQESRRGELTPADLVNLALERSPETRATWLTAQAAAASYGAARGQLFPDIAGSINLDRLKTAATNNPVNPVSVEETTFGPTITMDWLLLDFGGRSGAIDAARQGLFAANWTHNALIADLVRRTLQGYFAYVAARGLNDAQLASLQEAQANLQAADDRRTAGVATIEDVLQARTALGQARLQAQQAEGSMDSARGALATLIGLPPDAKFDVDTTGANAPVDQVTDEVDSLMRHGLLDRPDLAAERAQVDIRRAQAREARSQYLPSLSAIATAGTVWVNGGSQNFPSYNLGLAVALPLFNGFGWQYAARAAALTADAEEARLRTMEQQVALQVYQTYQQLRTATRSVTTSDELYTSASESADAARERYRQGVGSVLELLTAESALASARAQRIQSRVDWHMSLVQLAHDAGLLAPSGAMQLRLTPVPSSTGPGNNR